MGPLRTSSMATCSKLNLSKNRNAGHQQPSSNISMGSGNDDGAGPSPDQHDLEDDQGDSADNPGTQSHRSRTHMTEDQPTAQHETGPKAECIFGIFAPGFCLESISVNLQTPSTVHAVTHATQAVREVCSGIPLPPTLWQLGPLVGDTNLGISRCTCLHRYVRYVGPTRQILEKSGLALHGADVGLYVNGIGPFED